MRIGKAIGWSLLLIIMLLGGCGAGKQDSNQPVVQVKMNNGKQSVAKLIALSENIKGYSYSYAIDINGDKKTGKVWARGNKRRAETMVDGKKVITIYDGHQQMVYSYYPQEREAIKMPAEDTPELVAAPDDYLRGILNDRINLLGETLYRGYQCRLILAQDLQSQAHIKLWVNTKWGLPIRVESTDPDGNSCVVEYSQVKLAEQPAVLFKLPAGIKIVDLEQMMKQVAP
ncbi:MAG: LolA family protein [Methylocystaceae bacterium]